MTNFPAQTKERNFVRFLNRAHLDLSIPTIFVGSFFLFALARIFNVFPQHSFDFGYPVILLILFCCQAIYYRRQFSSVLLGLFSKKQLLIFGLAPLPIALLFFIPVIFSDVLFHTSPQIYLPQISFTWNTVAMLAIAPFLEELIFRAWLQTRLQQLGRFIGSSLFGIRFTTYYEVFGALLCAIFFVAIHPFALTLLTVAPMAFYLTWLRFRYKSLGATILGHLAWDWAFAVFIAITLIQQR